MSGIVALAHLDGAPVPREHVATLTARLHAHGPDGAGLWHEGFVGLGRTLHAVYSADEPAGPSALGARLVVTADARIDDRETLCGRLRARGIHARADATDAELLLHAYDAWGERCCEQLLGDYSFALWDAVHQKLVCAVDPLGVKAFFYAARGELFVGSNALECVRAHPHVSDALDELSVGEYLLFGELESRARTIYADIARLPPGHVLVVERGEVRLSRYFTPPEPSELCLPRAEDYVAQLEELLRHAVRDRLRTSRVAVYMSGGVDSPLVARLAQQELASRCADFDLAAFTAVFDTLLPDDERDYASLAAESLGIRIDFQSHDQGGIFDWLGRIAPAQPLDLMLLGPSLDQLERVGARFAVALTGWDGDALLAAAVRWHWVERVRERRYGELARELTWYVAHERALPPIGVRTLLARSRERAEAWPFPRGLQHDLTARTSLTERWQARQVLPHVTSSRGPAQALLVNPAWQRIFDGYDRGCLPVAIEARHPLADLRVVRFALGLPAVPWCVDKHALRACLGDFPERLRTRRKTPLQGDPVREVFRRRGIGLRADQWQTPVLGPFVDVAEVTAALHQARGGETDLGTLLRAVQLGAWALSRPAANRLPGC